MAWVLVIGAAMVVFAGMFFIGKLPRNTWEFAAAALFLGVAGYAWQAHPGLDGAPKAPVENTSTADEAMVKQRREMGARFGDSQSWLVFSDGMMRQGQYASAAAVLRNAIKSHPDDPDLWVALGNALMGHSDGFISPAAQFAFQKAATLAPEHPGPPFFMGLALAQSGRLEEARLLWGQLLDRSPDSAPWRPDLEQRLARLDQMLGVDADNPAAPEAVSGSEMGSP